MSIKEFIAHRGALRVLTAALLVAFGLFLFVYGGYDDSPGGQGLGLVIAIYGVVRIVRKPKGI